MRGETDWAGGSPTPIISSRVVVDDEGRTGYGRARQRNGLPSATKALGGSSLPATGPSTCSPPPRASAANASRIADTRDPGETSLAAFEQTSYHTARLLARPRGQQLEILVLEHDYPVDGTELRVRTATTDMES